MLHDFSLMLDRLLEILLGQGISTALLLGVTLLSIVLLRRMLRLVGQGIRQRWRGWRVEWALRFSRQGRCYLALAREIRAGQTRIGRMLPAQKKNNPLLRTLKRFVERELPRVLVQAHTFIVTGDQATTRGLEGRLAAQQNQWNQSPPGASREALQRSIAEIRQQLAQLQAAQSGEKALLKNLQEAAQALRNLETEIAALAVVRSQSLQKVRDHLQHMAEGATQLREAHAELHPSREEPL